MIIDKKIKSLDELIEVVAEFRKQGRKVVHCHGVFDLLHIGHIRYFRQAAQWGDVLVVTVSPDRFVDKGSHRPAFTEVLRAEAVASQDVVDFVAINQWPTAEELLRKLRPDVYVKGSDFKSIDSDPTGKLRLEAEVCEEIGAELRLTQEIVFSSTNLINRFMSAFPDEVKEYLEIFRSRYTIGDIEEILDRMKSLEVTVVGDTILDDYHYCNPLGASSKEPVMAFSHLDSDMFAGGVLAVANHLSNLVKQVHLFTVLGETDTREDMIRESLNANVTPFFEYQKNAPTIRKRRYIEGYSMTKLFEIYHMDDSGLDRQADERLRAKLMERAMKTDLVVAADFGHGAISPLCREELVKVPFLAVNTQANAGNRGFHTISSYGRCDFISLAEPELRLDTRDKQTGVIPLTDMVRTRMGASMVAVTRGKKGSYVQTVDGLGVLVPAFASKVVDKIGSGDAFFSVAALAACLKVRPELVAFLGNVVGAIAVGIVGNKMPVTRDAIMKHVTSLLK
ncbi:MAG: adenylyltransferase/cytidyltransferase family protein [Pseudodesulfovibrio sp.]|uniref:Cytidyltransferase-related domain protein n=1 Tax=Pseudodesulfovibrio aespoeensis (strain ATCC 700646 / DSM 10631 / Aspo-2) TaxID=643562 RepID=E6VR06_PSEA9|nr:MULTISPECIES: PfkB family carbohydrate kinase [Pseudodesulfovibrio]MBU4190727.1 adenylyltransferase/cytidyltransferase family protein [Pseudomonadota bacterium]ADU62986.1 cytidyltransferase-related domain protein [Pseudodesulfovibrio aespoeensis Aspo-2]MBU4380233.1 adenylyltransferase/cytidyltransferase family protein [Pseudomonadota bacterium]MBU4475910.1 adenylyltransferase/cytidyltransferase family protein [Pseudomonadota bacterium]MBU4516748.1 adenylyltransferase/cytidyltransferase fami